MSWEMKGFCLILVAFYLWKDTNGFSVLKRASVVDWQSGNSDSAHDQNIQLAKTPQPFVLLSRNSTNGNVGGGGGNSNSVPFTSEVQTAQGDFHYVQVSGGAVSTLQQEQGSSRTNIPQDQSLAYSIQSMSLATQASGSKTQSWSQAGCTRQDSASQSAPDSPAQGSYGAESSRHAKWYTILRGQTVPSSSHSVATNQASGSQAQSSYLASATTQVLAGQSASTIQAPAINASTWPQEETSIGDNYSEDLSLASSYQSVVTNQALGSQSQSSYQAGSTRQDSASQSASNSQAQGSYGVVSSGPSDWYTISHGQSIPFSSQSVATNQVLGSLTQPANQPSTKPLVLAGQSASSFYAQSLDALTLQQEQGSSRYDVPSNQSLTSVSQSQSSYQPSSTAQGSASQSAFNSQAQGSYGADSLGHTTWYTISHGQRIPLSSQSVARNQASGSHSPSYQAGVVLAGPSSPTSSGQSLGVSPYPGRAPGGNVVLQDLMNPSSLPVSESQTQSVLASLSADSQAQGSYGADSSGRATWYTILHESISSASQAVATNQAFGSRSQLSFQASSTVQDSANQSAANSQAQGSYGVVSSGPSNWYIVSHGQSVPFSSHSVATNQVLGSLTQPAYQPSTTPPVLAGQSASSSYGQSLDALTLQQEQDSSRYDTPSNQSLTYAVQSVSQSQSSYQPSSTTQDSASQSASNSQAQGSYGADSSGYATWYTISHGPRIPLPSQSVATNQASGSHSQSSYQTGSTSQSASTSPAQPSDASTFDRDLTSGWSKFAFGFYLPSQAAANSFGQIPSAQTDNL